MRVLCLIFQALCFDIHSLHMKVFGLGHGCTMPKGTLESLSVDHLLEIRLRGVRYPGKSLRILPRQECVFAVLLLLNRILLRSYFDLVQIHPYQCRFERAVSMLRVLPRRPRLGGH